MIGPFRFDIKRNTLYDLSFDELPAEVLAIIFKNYITSEGHLEYFSNVIPVCRIWRDVGLSFPSLVGRVNLDGVKNKVQGYLPDLALAIVNWGFPVMTELRLTCLSLNQRVTEALFSGCPNLKSLSFSDCRVHETTFVFVVRHCRKLESIAVDGVKQNGDVIERSTLEPIFLQGGQNLKSVSMSNQTFRNELDGGDLVTAILDNCPHLEQLKLSTDIFNFHWPRFPEEKLRTCCPRLRVLTLERYVLYFDSYTIWQTEALRNLEDLELISLVNIYGFLNVLRNAKQLKQLTMKNVSVYRDENHTSIYQHIGSKSLEKLHLVNTIFGRFDLEELLKRWRHSLKVLTLVNNWYFPSKPDLLALVRGNKNPPYERFMNQEEKPALEVLKLSVPIKDPSLLVHVVRECKRLRALDTSECSNLPEAYRWKLDTVEEINSLRDSLCSSRTRDDHSDSENAGREQCDDQQKNNDSK